MHNTKRIDKKMLSAIDVLCKYKGKYIRFYKNYDPIYITFLTKDNTMYHIIVADEENKKGVVKVINKHCDIPFLYCIYPELKVIN